MRVEFHHRKNGFLAFAARSMKSNAPAVTSSSTVSIRLMVSGPVSSILAVGGRFDHATRTKLLFELGVLWVVRVFRFLFGIQVIQVAKELIKAMIGRQVFVTITQVILAVLGGHVPVILEQSRRSSGL